MDAPEIVVYNLDSLLFQGVCSLVKYDSTDRYQKMFGHHVLVWYHNSAPFLGLLCMDLPANRTDRGSLKATISRQLQHYSLIPWRIHVVYLP